LKQTYIAPGVMQGTGLAISRKFAGPGLAGQAAAAGEGGRWSSSP